MAVEIGIRINSENMTSQDFDKLVGDLKRTEKQFGETDKEADKFGNTLAAHRTQLDNVAVGAAAVTDGLGLVGESFVESAIRMEGYRNGLIALEGSAEVADTSLTSLREIIELPGVSYEMATQAADQLKTIVFEAERANRAISDLGNALALVGSIDLSGALPGVQQIISRGRVSQEDIDQNPTVTSVVSRQTSGIDAFNAMDEGVKSVVAEFEGGNREIERGVVEPIRNFKLELVDLNVKLLDAEETFRNIKDISELERVTQRHLSVLDAVTQVTREEIEAQIAVEGAALARLDNQERAESEHALKLQELAEQNRQLEEDYEQEKTRIMREEVEKRTELRERAAQERLDNTKREAEARLKMHKEVFVEIARTLREMESVSLRDRTSEIYGGLLTQGVVPREAFEQAEDFITLTDGMEDSLQRLETGIHVFSALFRREFTRAVQSGVEILNDFRDSLRAPRLSALAEEVRGSDVISRLEEGQPARDRRTAKRFATGADAFKEQDKTDTDKAVAFVSSLRGRQGFARDRLVEGAGDLVSAVPLDVVDAVTDIVQVRRDANVELVVLEQESAAEIQIIQESVTLSAENKAKAIERVEREAALKRIQIENAVSQRQRASFQSVVTNFVSGVGRMIAAEAQLALARRATNAISGLFGGVSGGASLLSSVFLPLLGGLSLAYGASKLIAPSSPSADVYERSQFGVFGDGANRSAQQTPGLTRASQETDTPVLEANINVNVEASGTRLGQANERVKLKTERWGG